MFAKLITVVVTLTCIAALVLGFRHQRLLLMHQTARLHAQLNRNRMDTWQVQVQIAELLNPVTLSIALDRKSLNLEPASPTKPIFDGDTEYLASSEDEAH